MDETRRRMHTLLEDAFALIGPSLTGKKRKGGEMSQNLEQTRQPQETHALSGPQSMQPELIPRPVVRPRFAFKHDLIEEELQRFIFCVCFAIKTFVCPITLLYCLSGVVWCYTLV